MNYTFYNPVRVMFGAIAEKSLIEEVTSFGRKVLVLTGGPSTKKHAEQIADFLNDKCDVRFLDGVQTNPSSDYIEKIAKEIEKPEVIVTVGGGSVHDAGKALSLAITHPGSICEYAVGGAKSVAGIKNELIPIITIPTIFGTGAEISPAALLKFGIEKKVVFSSFFYPKLSFVDPSLAVTAAKEDVVSVALDGLVQGVESYTSTLAQPFSQVFSEAAIKHTVAGLICLNKTHEGTAALEQIALGSLESLYAVGQSSVGAAHAASDPLSGRFNIHHGAAVGALLPFVVKKNYPCAPGKYEKLCEILADSTGIERAPLWEMLFSLYAMIGFSHKSILQNVDRVNYEKNREALIKESFNADMVGNPRDLSSEMVGWILDKAVDE